MSETDTKDRIVRSLRNTGEPALSAADLADKIDVSVRTINNHVSQLVGEERIETTQIGNATAYYIPIENLPAHKKPDHTCARCGREVNETHDFARVDVNTYFHGDVPEDPCDFFVFCRFCYADLISWVLDPGALGTYHDVHSWDIPDEQLKEVREDPDIPSKPTSDPEILGPEEADIYEIVKDNQGEDGISEDKILEIAEEQGMPRFKAENALNKLNKAGFVWRKLSFVTIVYKTAK